MATLRGPENLSGSFNGLIAESRNSQSDPIPDMHLKSFDWRLLGRFRTGSSWQQEPAILTLTERYDLGSDYAYVRHMHDLFLLLLALRPKKVSEGFHHLPVGSIGSLKQTTDIAQDQDYGNAP